MTAYTTPAPPPPPSRAFTSSLSMGAPAVSRVNIRRQVNQLHAGPHLDMEGPRHQGKACVCACTPSPCPGDGGIKHHESLNGGQHRTRDDNQHEAQPLNVGGAKPYPPQRYPGHSKEDKHAKDAKNGAVKERTH